MTNMRISTCHLLAIAGAMAFSQAAVAQDAGRGKAVFEQCAACHSLESGHNETGPYLKGIVGRKSAGVDDFIYSPAMRRANVTWTPEQLDAFLKDPQAPPFRGNRMPFAGIPDAQARADVIAYLQSAGR
jgi:cytochrome c